jgi:hypothetical protein
MKLKYPEFRKILFIVTVLWVGGFVVQGTGYQIHRRDNR